MKLMLKDLWHFKDYNAEKKLMVKVSYSGTGTYFEDLESMDKEESLCFASDLKRIANEIESYLNSEKFNDD